ncbi:maltokinase N-terminal cap-like domain-containing protein [Actinoplanes palleronii]|uniref:Maltokinase N-terminal cap domain-containing protein n=1 Tax=Actinoplanes palleronii TaxID=113570 RepID=A0ABQ4BHB8_9ACTN|nr:hypothetical protein [Actinoplanes palleronii]GIE69716.1 hypothetical protein Apa02nite_058240 [Actinoplanes palleronii]
MALLHKTEIKPTKLELLGEWLPGRSWAAGAAGAEGAAGLAVSRVAAGRFDDPAGVVGLEVMLVRVGDGPVLHVPLTYRGAPLAGAEEFLVGTTEHGVLGTRWVYDAAGDPVFVSVLTDVIRTGGTQAAEELHDGDQVIVREPNLLLRGSGSEAPGTVGDLTVADLEVTDGQTTLIGTSMGVLRLFRTPTQSPAAPDGALLTAHWSGVDTPIALASLAT